MAAGALAVLLTGRTLLTAHRVNSELRKVKRPWVAVRYQR
jgi:hypothetical protein